MALTANDFAQQIVAQARVQDPSFSGEVGTPERKIIDTFSISLANNQIDLSALRSALDIDSKYGTNLDRFTSLFGFKRQQAQAATGYAVFSRNTPAPAAVTIPTGVTLQAAVTLANGSAVNVQFTTTGSGVIAIGQTASGAVPIRAVVAGTIGNVAANTITSMVGTPVPGVTSVTNQAALSNGFDTEDDNSYKVRFKNTVFRNLAGTNDQYLALAVAGAFTTKANVIGVQSRYQEYIQIPSYDDAGYLNGVQTTAQDTYGLAGNFTTAQSAIPYAKQVYTDAAVFVSNGQSGPAQFFYRPIIDFTFNFGIAYTGDTLRTQPVTTTSGSQSAGATITVASTSGFPTAGSFVSRWSTTNGPVVLIVSYTGKTATTFTGCTGGLGTLPANSRVYLAPSNAVQPNLTFYNVWNSTSTPAAGLQALSPGSLVLVEFAYISSASRNDATHFVNNAVDVYVDGSNPVQGSTVFVPRWVGTDRFVSNSPSLPFFAENFRRDGEPTRRPQLGNYITPLFQSPLLGLPASITVGSNTYYEGWHYWLVRETGALGGSIRARDGIEWNPTLPGDPGGQTPPALTAENTQAPYYPTGSTIVAACGTQTNLIGGSTSLSVNSYLYDANVPALQASVEAARQVTTDVLVHRASSRYFKLDITVMYSSGANYAAVNASIAAAVQAFFQRQYFGTVIQLSDLLDVVHQVPGVDNVRWSNDLPTNVGDLIRVVETDVNGVPLHGAFVERLAYGTPTTGETQTLYVVGMQAVPPFVTGTDVDSFTLSWLDPALSPTVMTTAPIPFFDANGNPLGSPSYSSNTGGATFIQNAIQAVDPTSGVNGIYTGITVAQDVRPSGVVNPITSFTLTYPAPSSPSGTPVHPYLPVITNSISASQFTYDSDFFLLDNELPSLPTGMTAGDTLPGLIIRPRAQNTWNRPGLT